MNFGFWNTPSTSERALNVAIAVVKWLTVIHLNVVKVFFCSAAEQTDQIEDALKLLRGRKGSLKATKCSSLTRTLDYFAHSICSSQLNFASHTTDPIKELNGPRKVTELRSTLGLYNVFRRLVPNFAEASTPSNKLRKHCRSTSS